MMYTLLALLVCVSHRVRAADMGGSATPADIDLLVVTPSRTHTAVPLVLTRFVAYP